MRFSKVTIAMAALSLAGVAYAGNIITVPAGDAVSGLTVAGLNGGVYHDGNGQPLTGNASTEVPALRAIIANGANSTFNAEYLNFNGSDSSPTNTELGLDANGTAALDTTAFATTVIDMNGLVSISTPGTYTFGVQNSDDASYIFIDGQMVADVPGSHGGQSDSGMASFSAAGNYPIEVLYVNQTIGGGGGASFQYYSDFSGAGTLHTELMHSVPEPASLGLAGFGIFGMLARRRKI